MPCPSRGRMRPRAICGCACARPLAEARELLRSPVFLIFLAAASFDQGSHAFYYAYGGLHWRELGYSGTLIGIIWPLGVLAEILLMSFSLRVFRALGATKLLLFGGIGCVLRWTILGFDPPLPFVDLRAVPAWRDLRHGASGGDVFHPEGRAAAARRNRAEPLCGELVRHRAGLCHHGLRPALCALWRADLFPDGGDGADFGPALALAHAACGRADASPRRRSKKTPATRSSARADGRGYRFPCNWRVSTSV